MKVGQKHKILIDSKEVGLEVSAEKSKYMLMPHQQNAGQNHNINISNRPSENVAQFIVFGNNSNKSNLNID
jgi:hypothetical protein